MRNKCYLLKSLEEIKGLSDEKLQFYWDIFYWYPLRGRTSKYRPLWYAIQTGCYRDDKLGPMQVVSGPMGMEKVHYQAPDASILDGEMEKLFDFVNNDSTDNVIKAGITHL